MGGTFEAPLKMALCSIICLPNFMKVGTGVQAILRFCFSNFRDCIIGNTDGMNLSITTWTGLRCYDLHTRFHKVWLRNSKVDSGGGGTCRYTDSKVIS